jgi:hypothetical protein
MKLGINVFFKGRDPEVDSKFHLYVESELELRFLKKKNLKTNLKQGLTGG